MPRGHQKGVPGEGQYGRGIKTEVARIPAGSKEHITACVIDLPLLIKAWKEKSKDTRDWTQLNRFMEELEALLPSILEY